MKRKDIDPVLILLWIMERMDGVSISSIARREGISSKTVGRVLKDYGCPPPEYALREEYDEALAVWNTGAFTWNEVANECRFNMSGDRLRDLVTYWARKNGREYKAFQHQGTRPNRRIGAAIHP